MIDDELKAAIIEQRYMKLRAIPWLLSLLVIFLNNHPTLAEEEEPRKEVALIYERVQQLISKQYPEAKFERKNGTFLARFNTRSFMIHHAFKTGEWQEARPQEGPNRGGIQCSISASPGQWNGAAMVPQTFDYRYFSSLLMAPYNKKLNMHLAAHLDYPDDASPQFVSAYQKLISSFSTDKDPL